MKVGVCQLDNRPEGDVLATTSEDDPFVWVDIDPEFARHSKNTYPRYLRE